MTAPTPGYRVLIVEDEAVIAMMLEEMLAELGHTVEATAGRIEAAAQCARDLPIDLAILDLNLHGADTYPIAAALTARGVPFIFATGYGAGGLRSDWAHAPVLQKPFQVEDLAPAIAQAMRSKD